VLAVHLKQKVINEADPQKNKNTINILGEYKMATQTLIEAAKLIHNDLVKGVVNDFIIVDPLFDILPFDGFTGQNVTVNRESVQGDTGFYLPGDSVLAKNPSQTVKVTFYPTKIIGDAEVDGLIQSTSGSAGVDQLAIEVRSKARKIGQDFQRGMATGNGTLPLMNSYSTLADAAFDVISGTAGVATTGAELVKDLYALLDNVKAKGGAVDFIVAHPAVLRLYREYRLSLGGSAPVNVELSSGRNVMSFDGIPFFANDALPINLGLGTNETEIFAGVFDDGTRKLGIAGIAPENNMGIDVIPIGQKENTDDTLIRVRWIANFASFNRNGLAKLKGVKI